MNYCVTIVKQDNGQVTAIGQHGHGVFTEQGTSVPNVLQKLLDRYVEPVAKSEDLPTTEGVYIITGYYKFDKPIKMITELVNILYDNGTLCYQLARMLGPCPLQYWPKNFVITEVERL